MRFLTKGKKWINHLTEFIASLFLVATVIIITVQVFTRYFFSYTSSWSEETSLILLVWIGFLGIAVGFRDQLHISVEFLAERMPMGFQKLFGLLRKLLVIGVGILFVYQGMEFTLLMANSTMPGTKLPSSVLYAAVPVAGALMLIYGIEDLFRKNDRKQTKG